MRKIIFLMFCFVLFFNGANLKVRWTHSESNDVAGYRVYIGNQSRVYDITIDAGYDTLLELVGLNDLNQKYYIAITAYDESMNESEFSDELTINVKNLASDTLIYDDSKVNYCLSKIWLCEYWIIGYFDSLTVTDSVRAANDTCLVFEIPVINDWKNYKIRNLVLDSNHKHARIMDAQIDVPMTGDFDSDGDIDITDLRNFDKSYGSTEGTEKYKMSFDLIRDGKINIDDMKFFDKRYGSRK